MTDSQPDLCLDECRKRQGRVRAVLQDRSLDRAVFVSHENVQYLTGFRPHRLMQAAVMIDADEVVLSAPNTEPERAADLRGAVVRDAPAGTG